MGILYVCPTCRKALQGRVRRLEFIPRTSGQGCVRISTSAPRKRNAIGQQSDHSQILSKNIGSATLNGPDRRNNYRLRPNKPDKDDILENIFKLTRRPKAKAPVDAQSLGQHSTSARKSQDQGSEIYTDIDLVRRMLYGKSIPIQDTWKALQNTKLFASGVAPLPNSEQDQSETPQAPDTRIFREFLLEAVRQRASHSLSSTLSISAIVTDYIAHGFMRVELWNSLLWCLLGTLYRLRDDVIRGLAINTIRQDTLEVWNLYTTILVHSNDLTEYLPTLDVTQPSRVNPSTMDDITLRTTTLEADIFDLLLHSLKSNRLGVYGDRITLVAIFTYLALQINSTVIDSRSLKSFDATRLSDLIACLTEQKGLTRAKVQEYIVEQGISSDKTILLVKYWSSLQDYSQPTQPAKARSNTTEFPFSPILQGLQVATKTKDLNLANKLWIRLVKLLEDPKLVDQLQLRSKTESLSPLETRKRAEISDVFLKCLKTFVKIGHADKAVEVWNFMGQNLGFQPGPAHWVMLLDSCKRSMDALSLNDIWQKIKEKKIQPDHLMWTAYIDGLLNCKDWKTALKALEDMGEAWKSARSGQTSQIHHIASDKYIGTYLPHIAPINAALTGLIALGKGSAASTVLKWAIAQNVKPDSITFNVILKHAVNTNNMEEIQRILIKMEEFKCPPDDATITALISGLLQSPTSSFYTQNPEQQKETMIRLLNYIEQSGFRMRHSIYSRVLHDFLIQENPNLLAAHAVLAHMAGHNMQPDHSIYTILIRFYFSTHPPSLVAIDSLWQRIQREKTPLDHIFYDRMIEGYARVGEIEKMLKFLRRMPEVGMKTGWVALTTVLRALRRAEEWDLIYELVADVLDKDGLFRIGQRGWRSREFWEGVKGLEEDGMRLPDIPWERIEAELREKSEVRF